MFKITSLESPKNTQVYTHMPFYIKETDEVLLCYQYKKRKFVNNKDPRFVQDPFLRWIPARYIQDTKEIIDLDLEQGYDYCNLYGYVQNNIINLSYLRYQQIMFDGITPFRFYNAQFTKEWNLISENEIDIEHFWNACSDDKHHYSSANKTITVYNKQDCSIKVKYEFPLLNGIYRVIKTHSNNLLITADYKDNFYSFIFNLKKQLKPLKLKIYTNQPQPSQFLLQNSNNTKYQNPSIFIPISHFKSNQPSSILQFYLTPTKSNIKFNQKQIHSIYNLIF